MEVATGKEMYVEKLPDNISASASPFATADGLIYFVSCGKSLVLKAGPKFEVVAINDLNDINFVGFKPYGYSVHVGGRFDYNSAAVSGGRIFVQGHSKLWCIGK